MPDVAALQRAIDEMNAGTAEMTDAIAEQNRLLADQAKELAAVKNRLPTFVPKRRFRQSIAGVVVVVLAALGLGGYLQWQDRQNSIRGCERANDSRATLRQVVEIAVAERPPPADLPPELVELYRQGQASTAALRERLLGLEGVQPVDCGAQYPGWWPW